MVGADQNEMSTRIWVRDYGIGIEEGEEEKVFQRFYRGKNAAKKSVRSFGGGMLGLFFSSIILFLF